MLLVLSFVFCRKIFLGLLLSHFFFSSRRRHTRSKRDWSSDVCSSDLEAAVQIGRRLARLATRVQVIVVTHLPQVAAYANKHLRVNKDPDVEAGFPTSDVSELLGEERISELARMLAGQANSSSAREHARELLEASYGRADCIYNIMTTRLTSMSIKPCIAVQSGISSVTLLPLNQRILL